MMDVGCWTAVAPFSFEEVISRLRPSVFPQFLKVVFGVRCVVQMGVADMHSMPLLMRNILSMCRCGTQTHDLGLGYLLPLAFGQKRQTILHPQSKHVVTSPEHNC